MTTNQQLLFSGAVLAALYFLTRRPSTAGTATPGFGASTIPPAAPSRVRAWRDAAVDAGRTFGVSPQLVLAVVWQESAGIENARGSAGEVGLMQIKDIAARDVGFNAAPWPGRANIQVGTAFLAKQIDRMGGDVYDGLRAYNRGETGARRGEGHKYASEVLRKAGWT